MLIKKRTTELTPSLAYCSVTATNDLKYVTQVVQERAVLSYILSFPGETFSLHLLVGFMLPSESHCETPLLMDHWGRAQQNNPSLWFSDGDISNLIPEVTDGLKQTDQFGRERHGGPSWLSMQIEFHSLSKKPIPEAKAESWRPVKPVISYKY